MNKNIVVLIINVNQLNSFKTESNFYKTDLFKDNERMKTETKDSIVQILSKRNLCSYNNN